MAPGVDSDVNEATPSSTSAAVHGERSQHRQESTITEQAQVNSLDYLRKTVQEQGADQTLAEFICGSWRGSMKSQYACAWRTWSEWCGGYAVPRTQPTVGQFADYLRFLYQVKQMAWSTIRLHRAAVATIIDPLTQNPLSQHPMICRFMKVVYLAKPPARKVKPIWSVAEVLQLLKSWGESETLCRPMLTWRMPMLLVLASAKRASDLALLYTDANHLFRSVDSWRFHLYWPSARSRTGRAIFPKTSSSLDNHQQNCVP